MKKILLLALLSLGINASIVVIDFTRVEAELREVIFKDSIARDNFWKNNWSDDLEVFRKEKHLDLILLNYDTADGNFFPCGAFSANADTTKEFIDWLKHKYLNTAYTSTDVQFILQHHVVFLNKYRLDHFFKDKPQSFNKDIEEVCHDIAVQMNIKGVVDTDCAWPYIDSKYDITEQVAIALTKKYLQESKLHSADS